MKVIPLLFVLWIPLCVAAGNDTESFTSEKDLSNLAKSIEVEVEAIKFLKPAIFNSINDNKKGDFEGYRGFVAATDCELVLVLNKSLKPRRQDLCIIPFEYLGGISRDEDQVQMKYRRQVIVVEFWDSFSKGANMNQHSEFFHHLRMSGVKVWEPSKNYDLVSYKKAFIGVPYTKPSIFSSPIPRSRTRLVSSYNHTFYHSPNQWDPDRWSRIGTPSN